MDTGSPVSDIGPPVSETCEPVISALGAHRFAVVSVLFSVQARHRLAVAAVVSSFNLNIGSPMSLVSSSLVL